jgi:hypothetical protein
MNKHYIKSKTNYRQALEENTLKQKSKKKNKNTKEVIMVIIIPLTQI